MIYRPK